MLARITPVILTLNEAANLARALAPLAWAREVLVVDSGSTDATVAIAHRFPNVRVVVRPFASFAEQWGFAVSEPGIATDWVLRLDADYVVTEAFRDELARLSPPDDVDAYRAAFVFCINGHRLAASVYPPNTVLLRRARARTRQDGHTERWEVPGRVEMLDAPLLLDDRKAFRVWAATQARYAEQEAAVARPAPQGLVARLRARPALGPVLVLVYVLFVKGLVRDGRAGLAYALERMIAEALQRLARLRREIPEAGPEADRVSGGGDGGAR